MTQAFDAAAFMAAMQAAAARPPRPVTLPGVGDAFKREITVADVEEAGEIRAAMSKDGQEVTRKMSIAIGLAQSLCGPDGVALFDPRNAEHLALLAALPWSVVRSITQDDKADEKND